MLLSLPVMAGGDGQEEIERMRKEMYRLYSTDSLDRFMAVTDNLKKLARSHDNEQLFYKAWSNQALFVFRKVSRSQGLDIVKEEREYALENDEKFGLYAASSAYTTMMSSIGLIDEAEKGLYESIGYLHRYFPEESAAVDYIGLAKIYENKHDYQKMMECARLALQEPNVSDIHQVSAKSYICVGLAKMTKTPEDKKRFEEAYQDYLQASEKYGLDGGLSTIPHFYHAKLNGRYAEALEYAKQITSKTNRLPFVAEGYELNGNYRQAYEVYKDYKKFTDSVNTASVMQQTAEYALQLDVARAENETKDLRLANQALWMKTAGMIAVLTLAFLIFYLLRRRQQLKKLRSAYDRLEETTTAKEQMESELRVARNIQLAMVPSKFPAFPDRRDLDLYASMTTAKEVGGDLYDYLLQDNQLYFCIGDVSGKGVPASMLMAVVVNLFRMFAKEGNTPAQMMMRMNEALSTENSNGTFVSMFIGVADLTAGRLDFCNAGHNPPVIIDVQHPSFMELESNVVLGLWPEAEFVQESLEDFRGKMLLLYSDGLTEAENGWQEQFEEARLTDALKSHRLTDARSTVEMLRQEVKSFVGNAESSDDITMLCVSVGEK